MQHNNFCIVDSDMYCSNIIHRCIFVFPPQNVYANAPQCCVTVHCLSCLIIFRFPKVYNVKCANDIKCQGKILHISIGEDTEGEKRYSSTLSLTSALEGVVSRYTDYPSNAVV